MRTGNTKTLTPKQIEANRHNALQSTGPRTPAGPLEQTLVEHIVAMLRRSPRGENHICSFPKTNPYDGGCKNRKTSFFNWNRRFSTPGSAENNNLFYETNPNEWDPFLPPIGRQPGLRPPRARRRLPRFTRPRPATIPAVSSESSDRGRESIPNFRGRKPPPQPMPPRPLIPQ